MKSSPLLKAAMLGTNRSTALGNPPHSALHECWRSLASQENTAEAVLQAAALEYMTSMAGATTEAVELPTACDPETKPYIPHAAAVAFIELCENSFKPFIGEWITVAQARGYVVRPRLLPELLAFGETNESFRSSITDIAGHRGQWLAVQTGKWKWIHTTSDAKPGDDLWQTGSLAERLTWLSWQLANNPENASTAIADSWSGDSPETREAVVEVVAGVPHMAHEVWLQQYALPDRRQNTRRLAIRTLMKIPGSEFRKRSLQRAAALVSTNQKLLSRNSLSCEPPTAFDKIWIKDGLREKPPSGSGQRDYWLLQILSVIPLGDWPEITGHDDPLSLKIDSDWAVTVFKAWQHSAQIHPDADALPSLLKRLAAGKDDATRINSLAALLGSHSPDKIGDLLEPLKIPEGQCLELLRKTLPVLDAVKHPALHKVACNWVFTDQHLAKNDAIALAGCCDRHAIPALLEKISKAKKLSAAAEEFTRGLEYRQHYLKHFTEQEDPDE